MHQSEVSKTDLDVALPTRKSVLSPKVIAIRDLTEGSRRWWVWGLLAWFDIKKRYRGSVLGPFWLTITTAITIASIGLLNSQILGVALSSYMPFLSLGMIVWALISTMVNDSTTAFTSVEHVIKQIKMPLSTQIYRIVYRNFIIFLHNTPVIILVAIACQVPFSWADLLMIPGFALLVLWVIPLALLLGSICARFRDVPQMVSSILQLAFFLSPIMWKPEMLGTNARLALFNPFASFLEVIREPLLGKLPDPLCWLICFACVGLTWGIAFPFFVRFRARIAYWA
jgi:ABC-2 type transport system permease protein/lipopolysaccharide transport system permease protein